MVDRPEPPQVVEEPVGDLARGGEANDQPRSANGRDQCLLRGARVGDLSAADRATAPAEASAQNVAIVTRVGKSLCDCGG